MRNALRQLPSFVRFSDPELDHLLSIAQLKEYEHGVMVFEQGRDPDAFYVVLSGALHLMCRGTNGMEYTKGIEKDTGYGDENVTQDFVWHYSGVTVGTTTLAIFRMADFDQLMESHPSMAEKLPAKPFTTMVKL